MANLVAHAGTLAKALRRAIAENSAPNTFYPRELATHYGGPPTLIAGRIGRREPALLSGISSVLGLDVTYTGAGGFRVNAGPYGTHECGSALWIAGWGADGDVMIECAGCGQ